MQNETTTHKLLRKMIETMEYWPGAYMCHSLSRHYVKRFFNPFLAHRTRKAKEEIRSFMDELHGKDNADAHSTMFSAITRYLSRKGISTYYFLESDVNFVDQIAFDIYNDWDNRWAVLNEAVNNLRKKERIGVDF